MKKWITILLLAFLLTGCGEQGEFETVGDLYTPEALTPGTVSLTLPGDAAAQTFVGDGGRLYLCDGYSVTVQTLQGGDLAKTLQAVTGFSSERLTVMETEKDGCRCYRFVWTAAGEGGDQIAQTVLLDDGNFHYAVTAMADSKTGGQLSDIWQEIFQSVKLRGDGENSFPSGGSD